MLNVGLDSYVTLEEANQFMLGNFTSTDGILTKWSEMSDSDKEVMLRNSCRDIDSLCFSGRKKIPGQSLQFPRIIDHPVGIGYRLFIGQMYDNGLNNNIGNGDGLRLVKQAQMLNAAYACKFKESVDEGLANKIFGLSSKKAGPISESYTNSNSESADAERGIYTKKVYMILKPWLNDARISY